jgi:hypothetical protein
MLDLKNIILIFIILFLLNQVKLNKSIKSNKLKYNKADYKNNSVEKMSQTPTVLDKDLLSLS